MKSYKIKLVIFDLDGVLIDAKHIHFDALNEALPDKFKISWAEHLSIYDGLKTQQKLETLTVKKNLPINLYTDIWNKKQQLTAQRFKSLNVSNELIYCMDTLVSNGYKIAICSNSIRKSVLTVLSKLGIIEFVDLILSNEDVKNSKPHPEIYWKAMSSIGVLPEETLIVEDSPYGLLAAFKSKSHIFRVKNSNEVRFENINKKIKEIESGYIENSPKWQDLKMNVLIPMAGAGSRFQKAGYTFPKPLIDVMGKPMIQLVVENLNIDANFIFVVQKEHREKYNIDTFLNLIAPNCQIIEVNCLTDGAACTALMAKELINNDNPLFFANSDQFIVWNSNEFFYSMNETNSDCGIVTFKATHPKWSFVKLDENKHVIQVAEKNPISDTATVGFYYWKHGSDFVKYAEKMIRENLRVNNEFYVAPVFNQAIQDNKIVRTFDVDKMWGIGTPEDLDSFIKHVTHLNNENL